MWIGNFLFTYEFPHEIFIFSHVNYIRSCAISFFSTCGNLLHPMTHSYTHMTWSCSAPCLTRFFHVWRHHYFAWGKGRIGTSPGSRWPKTPLSPSGPLKLLILKRLQQAAMRRAEHPHIYRTALILHLISTSASAFYWYLIGKDPAHYLKAVNINVEIFGYFLVCKLVTSFFDEGSQLIIDHGNVITSLCSVDIVAPCTCRMAELLHMQRVPAARSSDSLELD